MKQNLFKAKVLFTYFLFNLFLITVIIPAPGCKSWWSPDKDTTGPREIVVWIKPESTEEQYNAWLESLRSIYKHKGEIIEKRICESCDGTLRLLSGPGVETMIQGPPVSGGRDPLVSTKAVGEDGPVLISFNYPINMPVDIDTLPGKDITFSQPHGAYDRTKTKVKVGVFDTGVDTDEIAGFTFTNGPGTCIAGGALGWNFADSNNRFRDDHTGKHGTIVARLITEQVNSYRGANPVEILPVKTHGKNGTSNLYHVLCGLAYAQKQGVHIINASFGFYTPRFKNDSHNRVDPKIILLKKYIEHYLTRHNILLIAAAGNRDVVNERKAFSIYDDLAIPANFRDLENVSFYPASLAGDPDLPNVIAVTTVDAARGITSPAQNYSSRVVDIGVQADRVEGESPEEHFLFINPRSITRTATIEGSSFATPIATGKICAFYHLYEKYISQTSRVHKQPILDTKRA